MEIHRLTADEGPRLRAVRLRALRDAPDAFGTTFEEANAWRAETWTSQLEKLATFVAARDGMDIGLARGAPHDDVEDAAILLSMWVAPEARGQGVGDALVGAVAAWARAQGFRQLLLDVADTNARAIAFYARLGFFPTGAVSTLPPPREHILEHQRALDLSRRGTR
ncbi:GNAT family N-acetyltransferase [Pendulispora brunnea]|uniref:GNAT family N-acetyltransferase n=1 Tax=Pendulispora brunnea TaxID=2905690 RepID=A0ABZ2K033_9BACT